MVTAEDWLKTRFAMIEDPMEAVLGAYATLTEVYGKTEDEAWDLIDKELASGLQVADSRVQSRRSLMWKLTVAAIAVLVGLAALFFYVEYATAATPPRDASDLKPGEARMVNPDTGEEKKITVREAVQLQMRRCNAEGGRWATFPAEGDSTKVVMGCFWVLPAEAAQ